MGTESALRKTSIGAHPRRFGGPPRREAEPITDPPDDYACCPVMTASNHHPASDRQPASDEQTVSDRQPVPDEQPTPEQQQVSGRQSRRRGRPPSGGREAILEATLELLCERGIANLTSRDIAARAGVSDASVYYHFGDRAGLLRAVFEHGMPPLQFMTELDREQTGRREVLTMALEALEKFFDAIVPIIHAAQSDRELGEDLAAHIEEHDLGPHEGVKLLGDYLRAEQQAGRANPEADADAIALMIIDFAFSRAVRREVLPHGQERLPSPKRLLALVDQLLD